MITKRNVVAASFLVAAGLLATQRAEALTVNADGNASDLVSTLVGSGITVVPGSASYTGAASASGTFTNGGNIGISSGVLLTNGNVANAPGPNNSTGASQGNGLAGNPALTALSGQPTFDASTLNFSFTTTSGALSFNYVFGSEEYNEFVNQFNDVFAFFVDGQNIALIPGTSTPVAINNVNLNVNSTYYRNNDFQDGTAPYDTQYDGLTTVLTATVSNLSSSVHTISLSIADSGDDVLDSGVFLAGGTFTSNPTGPTGPTNPVTTPEPASILLTGIGLAGLGVARRRRAAIPI